MTLQENRIPRYIAAAAVLYVFAALLADVLIIQDVKWPFAWDALYRSINGFEIYKFFAWFVIPFLLALPWFDPHWFGVSRWKRRDWLLLCALVIVCLAAVLIIPLFPNLRALYSGLGKASAQIKLRFFITELLWIASWLPGWEFLHRYFLLRPMMRVLPRTGWLIVPVSEGLYHLQKPVPEMVGMIVFSLFLTYWAMKRRNVLLPFLAHFSIEFELVLFRLIV